MLGIWYVIQKTSTASSCILYNFTRTDEPGVFQVEETSQHFLLSLTPLKHGYHYRGTLKVLDESIPARMSVKFPLSNENPYKILRDYLRCFLQVLPEALPSQSSQQIMTHTPESIRAKD